MKKKAKRKKRKKKKKPGAKARPKGPGQRRRGPRIRLVKGPFQIPLPLQMPLFSEPPAAPRQAPSPLDDGAVEATARGAEPAPSGRSEPQRRQHDALLLPLQHVVTPASDEHPRIGPLPGQGRDDS
jgi:hypothetical protein